MQDGEVYLPLFKEHVQDQVTSLSKHWEDEIMSHSVQKVAFVTGSSRGIGYGIATQLNEEGYFVVMSGTSPIEKVMAGIQKLPHPENVLYLQGNIALTEDRQHFLGQHPLHPGAGRSAG